MTNDENFFTLEAARAKDLSDPLREYRDQFVHSSENLIYLDGNSLGRLPLRSKEMINKVVNEQWGDRLIRSWNTDWLDINRRIGLKIAQLIGAKPHEVILTDSTSLNLFKLAYGSLKNQGEGRTRIVSDEMNFPSDLYILQGLIDIFGNSHELVLAKSDNEIIVREEDVSSLINSRTSLVSLSYVSFKSAFKYDMNAITKNAHDHGAHIIWDLSHAVGAVQVNLNDSQVDMAVGCTYKYLNGGPGSLAFLYVREDLQDKIINPVWGWFADANPFDFEMQFSAAKGINRFLTSTTPILSAASTEPGIDLLLEAGIDRIRDKSVQQTQFLIGLVDKLLLPLGFVMSSPRDPEKRGSHIAISHPDAYRITQAMIHPSEDNLIVIPDFRAPDIIRLGVAPLYTQYQDIYYCVLRIKEIVETHEFEQYSEK